jgi:hypothetical protein
MEAFQVVRGQYPSTVDEIEQAGFLSEEVGQEAALAGLDISSSGSSYCLSVVGSGHTYWYSSSDGLTSEPCRRNRRTDEVNQGDGTRNHVRRFRLNTDPLVPGEL